MSAAATFQLTFPEVYWNNIIVATAWASAGGENGHLPPWRLGLSTNFFRKREVIKQVSIYWFNFAMSIYLPIWHSHCTRFRFIHFTVSELAVRSCPLLCVTKRASGFICCWSLLRNNYDSSVSPHLTIERKRLAWQVMQRHSNSQWCHSVFPLRCTIALYCTTGTRSFVQWNSIHTHLQPGP